MIKRDIFIQTKDGKKKIATGVFIHTICDRGVVTIYFVKAKHWKKFLHANPEYSNNDFTECITSELIPKQKSLVGGSYELHLSK